MERRGNREKGEARMAFPDSYTTPYLTTNLKPVFVFDEYYRNFKLKEKDFRRVLGVSN